MRGPTIHPGEVIRLDLRQLEPVTWAQLTAPVIGVTPVAVADRGALGADDELLTASGCSVLRLLLRDCKRDRRAATRNR